MTKGARLKVTGPVSSKKYKCVYCSHVSSIATNHYGDVYSKCQKCAWKRPMDMGGHHRCVDPVPAGWGTPVEWKKTYIKLS